MDKVDKKMKLKAEIFDILDAQESLQRKIEMLNQKKNALVHELRVIQQKENEDK